MKDIWYQIAIMFLIINLFYALIMYSVHGNFMPLIFRPNHNLDNNIIIKRRLYAIEFWISFIGFFIILHILKYN